MTNDDANFQYRVGLYANSWHDDDHMVGNQGFRQMWVDEVVVGTTYSDVEPDQRSGEFGIQEFSPVNTNVVHSQLPIAININMRSKSHPRVYRLSSDFMAASSWSTPAPFGTATPRLAISCSTSLLVIMPVHSAGTSCLR